MSRRIAFPHSCLALLLACTPALAAQGPHLGWDHCSADGQVANKSFACNANTGSEALVVSYESPLARTDRQATEITMHIAATGPSLPAWWSMSAAGTCRPTALTSDLSGEPGSACVDPYRVGVAGGVAAYQVGYLGPNTVRLLAAVAVPPNTPFTVGLGVEDFALRLNISHGQTIGTNACAGCEVPVCLGIGIIRLMNADLVVHDDIVMLGGSGDGGSASTVTWQGAHVLAYTVAFERTEYFASLDCSPSGPDPTRPSTRGL